MNTEFGAFISRSSAEFKKRVPGSCRFSPYYKAQWYDDKTMAWRDVSKRFETEAGARELFNEKHKWRVMKITMNGRSAL